MNRELTCIICPRGCLLQVEGDASNLSVTGNACPRGTQYAQQECTNPVRTLTTVLRPVNRCGTMVAVKTLHPIPKAAIPAAMAQLRNITVTAPVSIGDTVLDDLFGSPVVVTKGAE